MEKIRWRIIHICVAMFPMCKDLKNELLGNAARLDKHIQDIFIDPNNKLINKSVNMTSLPLGYLKGYVQYTV